MQTDLASWIRDTPDGIEADAILRSCVHCGFCNATCPTYQLLGDELDGPRGRIYLVKQVLEGNPATSHTQLHLDRCLTCRNCETTCPSGVEYGRLLDIGRRVVEKQVTRPLAASAARVALREGLTSTAFAPALRLGQALRPLLPAALRNKVPQATHGYATTTPAGSQASTAAGRRRMLLLAGCVQPAMMPNINPATARVLGQLGVDLVVPSAAGCCGAIRHHMADHAGACAEARRNIDAWLPLLEGGADTIVMNASGCGAMVREYDHLLRDDPVYAAKAARVVAATRDIAEVLASLLADPAAASSPASSTVSAAGRLRARAAAAGNADRANRIAFHPPCTLQHGQKIRGLVEGLLRDLGADLVAFDESHLCCGSAGTYSVLQPVLANQLRDRKLAHIKAAKPDLILSANVGCISHLQAGAGRPVMHWIEWLDRRLATSSNTASSNAAG
jgi:glycolate oxidase iron-sulfur subunit